MGLIPGNLLSYNQQSIETDSSGWSAIAGQATITQSTDQHLEGTHSLLVSASVAGDISISTSSRIPCQPNTAYMAYASAWFNESPSRQFYMKIVFYDSNGNVLLSEYFPSGYWTITQYGWKKSVMNIVSPPQAATFTMQLHPQSTTSIDTFYFDQMYFGPPTVAISATPSQANADNSLTVTGLTGWDTVAIQRTNPDGSQAIIRNANYVSTGWNDTFAAFDFEAPLGVACTYATITKVTYPSGNVYQATSPSVTATIPVASNVAWLKNLSQASLNTTVTIVGISDVGRPSRRQVYQVVGRKNAVVISDVLGGRTGTLSLMTTASTDKAAIKAAFAPGTTLLLQATPADGFDDLYFVPGDITERRPSATSTDTTRIWDIAFTETDIPAGSLTTIPGNSYTNVVNFGTYQNLINHRATYLDVLNTPYGSGSGGV